MNRIWAKDENKAHALRCGVKGIRCCQSQSAVSSLAELSPGGTYGVPDVRSPNPLLLDVTWDGPRAEFWVISRSHPLPSIAAPFWGEGNWQAQLSRAQLPSRVDQRTENRLWIVIKPSLQNPSLPTSSCATKCLLSSSQGVSFNCQLIFFHCIWQHVTLQIAASIGPRRTHFPGKNILQKATGCFHMESAYRKTHNN